MKITNIAILFALLLAPSCAWADVFVFQLPDEAPAYAQPYYQQQNRVQLAQRAPAPAPRPVAYASPCAQPVAAQQQYASLPQPIAQPGITRDDRTVYFGFGQWRLSKESQTKLNSLAIRPVSADGVASVYITGYADRIGSSSSNDKLSHKRADNVRNYLIDRQIIEPHGIETRWVGKSRASNLCSMRLPHAKLLRCLQPDRRVEVNINYRAQTWRQR